MLSVVLSGCLGNDRGPSIRLFEPGNKAPARQAEPKTAVSRNSLPPQQPIPYDGQHRVAKGETLYNIARTYRVPIRAIIGANDLKPPYALRVGQLLTLPDSPVYVVRQGDTVYGIANRRQVSMHELVRVNNLKAPYNISVGQTLLLPGKVVAARNAPSGATPARSATTDSNPVPAPKAPPAPARRYDEVTWTKAGFPRPYAKPQEPRKRLAAIPKPEKRSSSRFLWPLRGKVISRYGAKGKGLYNDGLNIAAPNGTAIRAAENGVVAYSGSELRGFGNLILVKHSGGFMTAYAHTSTVLVQRGDRIKRGQTIARVGSSGNVDRPQLHFQIRKGKQTVNPVKYLTR